MHRGIEGTITGAACAGGSGVWHRRQQRLHRTKSHNASNTPAKVTIVGSELGVSLVQTQDADVSAIANVEIGSGLNGWFANSRRMNRKKPLSFAKQCENRMKPPIRERI